MQKLAYILRYLEFLRRTKSEFDVHSPFLFDLMNKVFKDREVKQDFLRIESVKKQLLKSSKVIEVSDFGAGSKVMKDKMRPVSKIAKNSSKPVKYGRLLYRLSQYLTPRNSLELGTSLGLSAAYIALGNPETRLTTIEGCPNISGIAKQNFETLNLQNINLITGRFDDVLPAITEKIGELNFVFIDGNHRKEPTLKYFEQCATKAVNGTCMVFDDIHWSKEMEEAWAIIRQNKSVTLTIDLFFMGLVFFNPDLSKQDFNIRF